VVDVRTNQVLLWVRHTDTPYLASGLRRFCQRHDIVDGHFLVLNFDGDHQIMVTVFDEDMCRRQYVAPTRGKPNVSSSTDYLILLLFVLGYDLVCNVCNVSNAMQ
jgi:hypothetical protein